MPTVVLEDEKIADCSTVELELEGDCLTWLYKVAPAFPVKGSKVRIIHEPRDFYSTLLEKCKTARSRITIASLYLGTGQMEAELVKGMKEAIESNGGNLQVNILLDYMRGSRGQNNSKEMLMPLLRGEFGHCCRVFLYHTPRLRGFLKKLIPNRFNELVGLQHMKLYIFDNTFIISGANLSNDYFSNRQDRYFMIEDCEELCDFYHSLVKKVSEFSFELQADGETRFNDKIDIHPFKSSVEKFSKESSEIIHDFFQNQIDRRFDLCKKEPTKADTWVFPLIQMAQLKVRHDSEITLRLFETAPVGATLKLATGYFNLTSEYRNALVNSCRANCHVLTAHPRANGFFGARGIAGGIPAAYTKIEKSFFEFCEKRGQSDRIKLWEFSRPGWTYHAKGLWYSMPGQQKPSFTLVGSPNFGYRSVERDLETQIAVATRNTELQESLQKECDRLFSRALPVTKRTFIEKERIPPAWVRVAVFFFRYYF
ncbi:CDP-diacylglycerol--glycerol-3-phosphate 3-phosphatidyltransferase, mitochondrial [Copidosoma floridanum]|uniref:CDP-diacylglycerol--glycerol-3-phosphate 3-phosphatidyltransferase, mitochondrial n=1 Tax=Copidosoma floridanum TaxID=29053 RepID=UPI0006C9739B|nr:CDP-diacylglycerol--glycerol-3-phosphate 3-phosphatidyltransferase, mitochondrial [Copidosoma floridanum]